jgi:hypothetical protein
MPSHVGGPGSIPGAGTGRLLYSLPSEKKGKNKKIKKLWVIYMKI